MKLVKIFHGHGFTVDEKLEEEINLWRRSNAKYDVIDVQMHTAATERIVYVTVMIWYRE